MDRIRVGRVRDEWSRVEVKRKRERTNVRWKCWRVSVKKEAERRQRSKRFDWNKHDERKRANTRMIEATGRETVSSDDHYAAPVSQSQSEPLASASLSD